MSVQSEITRIQNAVNSAIAAIENKGVSVSDGAGVDDLAALIASIICPDVSKVTAAAGNVLAGKVFVDANGNAVTGTMTNQGAVSTTVEAGGTYTIPAGYHNGSGKVTGAASSGYQVVTGTISLTQKTQSLTVNHGLGSAAKGMFVVGDTKPPGSSTNWFSVLAASSVNRIAISTRTTSSSGSSYYLDADAVTWNLGTATATVSTGYASVNFDTNIKYSYVVWG